MTFSTATAHGLHESSFQISIFIPLYGELFHVFECLSWYKLWVCRGAGRRRVAKPQLHAYKPADVVVGFANSAGSSLPLTSDFGPIRGLAPWRMNHIPWIANRRL